MHGFGGLGLQDHRLRGKHRGVRDKGVSPIEPIRILGVLVSRVC